MTEHVDNVSENIKSNSCEVCNSSNAKYVCPRCECRTCCLKCNRIHKTELECTGERDKTQYISLKNKDRTTNLVLLSDYRLLEEVTRKSENFSKLTKSPLYLHHSLKKLQLAAAARKTSLKFFPSNFERRKKNSTKFDPKDNLIYWHIDWHFLNAENLKITNTEVSELKKLSSLISQHLSTEDENLQKKLLFYLAAGQSGISILLKAENKKGTKFYEVNPSDTLRECLKHKTLIEYPIFYVLLADHKFGFDCVDSDCEDEDIRDGEDYINRIINLDQQKNENLLNI